MTLTLRHQERLGSLSHISRAVAEAFVAYERPYDEGRVVDSTGCVVPDISPALKRAQQRVMDAAHAFEQQAQNELAAVEGKSA
jgi:hypothetical protein